MMETKVGKIEGQQKSSEKHVWVLEERVAEQSKQLLAKNATMTVFQQSVI